MIICNGAVFVESHLQIYVTLPIHLAHCDFAWENRVKEDVERTDEQKEKEGKVSLGSSQINRKLMSGSQWAPGEWY